jgi:hypothetical protein
MEEQNINPEMIRRDIDELRHDVYGNGKPGLKWEIAQIKTTLKFNTWLTGITSAALIGGIIKLIFFM